MYKGSGKGLAHLSPVSVAGSLGYSLSQPNHHRLGSLPLYVFLPL